ncbi:hypothetical protein QTP86_002987 [Hemibagrus guttatus]|nr:hypothetical protein QTP86_002987 [Hemibagrus guttatus]
MAVVVIPGLDRSGLSRGRPRFDSQPMPQPQPLVAVPVPSPEKWEGRVRKGIRRKTFAKLMCGPVGLLWCGGDEEQGEASGGSEEHGKPLCLAIGLGMVSGTQTDADAELFPQRPPHPGVSVTSPINLFIIVIYHPTGPLRDFLEEMDTLLSVFPSDSTPLKVLGDFNLPSDKFHSSGLLALLNSFSLSFKSCPPTHKEGNVLDLVFTYPSPATDMTATPLHISDHHLVFFTIILPILPKHNSQHLSLTRRNLHSISPSSVASCTLSSLPDHDSFSSLPLDSATDTLLSSLSSTMDLLCPLSTICKKNSSTAPWLSDVLRNNRRELRSAARKWKKSKLDTDLISYCTLLSKFSLYVTSAKTSFYKEKLETSAQDPQKLHNIFSSLLNPPAPPSPFSMTAKDFATFYTEKIERICQTLMSLPTSSTSNSQHSATPSLTQLSTVAAEEVLQITRSCNPTTCPLDPIPSAMLQTISPDLLPFIITVINGSLTSGHVPTVFKKARVIPILKKPALDPSDISNYRPNNLHDPNQSSFKAAHSTETALLAVTEKLHAARSAKLSSVLILLDLSAAFDTVNHKTLLSTLRSLGICGPAWEWFASYLDGRSYQLYPHMDFDTTALGWTAKRLLPPPLPSHPQVAVAMDVWGTLFCYVQSVHIPSTLPAES